MRVQLISVFNALLLFVQVDPKKRISLFKLRQTWNAIIPVQKLIAIDKHVHSIDSGWPVMPEPPSTPQSPTIFVNPKFIKVTILTCKYTYT